MPLDLIMFAALIVVILLGYPVAFFHCRASATAFALLGWWLDAFSIGMMGALGQRFFGVMTNPVLTAIPLFVLYGGWCWRSRASRRICSRRWGGCSEPCAADSASR